MFGERNLAIFYIIYGIQCLLKIKNNEENQLNKLLTEKTICDINIVKQLNMTHMEGKNMLTKFGKELRKIRIENDEILKDMADKLNVTSGIFIGCRKW